MSKNNHQHDQFGGGDKDPYREFSTQQTLRPSHEPAIEGSPNASRGGSGWRIFLALALGLIVGGGIVWLVLDRPMLNDGAGTDRGDGSAGNEDIVAVTPEEEQTTPSDEDLVQVKDQQAGTSVFISRIELTKSGWVAVHELLPENGGIGNVLGAQRFDAGIYQGQVSLLRDTVAGQEYFATIYHDDGDGLFSLEHDVPVTTLAGEPAGIRFGVFVPEE